MVWRKVSYLRSHAPGHVFFLFFVVNCQPGHPLSQPHNETHRTASGSATCPNAVASLQSKIDFLKNEKKSLLPKPVSHPPPGRPLLVQRQIAAVSTPAPPPSGYHPYPPHFSWPHPPPSYPPLQYGHPHYPPPPPQAQPASLVPAVPHTSSTTVSVVFSEYADL